MLELPVEPAWRLRGYALLARVLFPRSYLGKILLLTFAGTHVPLVALVGYLLLASGSLSTPTFSVLLVAFGATLVGSAGTVLGLWLLLAPVTAGSKTLRAYRLAGTSPRLPLNLGGEAGEFLADVQHTLSHLDTRVRDLADQALRDPLTGFPNRRAFEQHLASSLARAAHRREAVALAMLDLDGLKGVNDERGHAVGDACLRHVADVLTRYVGEHGWVARWGGDEFVMVVREAAGRSTIETLLAQVNDELAAAPMIVDDGGRINLQVSWGVARAQEGEEPQELFERADADLYRTRRAQRRALDGTATGVLAERPLLDEGWSTV